MVIFSLSTGRTGTSSSSETCSAMIVCLLSSNAFVCAGSLRVNFLSINRDQSGLS